MSESTRVGAEDLLPVHSRISWGAIIGGSVLALGLYMVLTLLGAAIGLSVRNAVQTGTLGVGAAVWAIATILVSLFAGGWVASQLSAGETKGEAAIYGLIVWGVVFAMFLWMVGMGLRAGFSAMVSVSQVGVEAAQQTSDVNWQAAARRAGVSQETLTEWQAQADRDPAPRVSDEQAAEAATAATWWTLAGTLLSMGAAVLGALVGAGPTFRLIPVRAGVRTTYRRPREPIGEPS